MLSVEVMDPKGYLTDLNALQVEGRDELVLSWWFFLLILRRENYHEKPTILGNMFDLKKHKKTPNKQNLSVAVKSWKMWCLVTLASTHRTDNTQVDELLARVMFFPAPHRQYSSWWIAGKSYVFSWVVAASKGIQRKRWIAVNKILDWSCLWNCFWMSLAISYFEGSVFRKQLLSRHFEVTRSACESFSPLHLAIGRADKSRNLYVVSNFVFICNWTVSFKSSSLISICIHTNSARTHLSRTIVVWSLPMTGAIRCGYQRH